MTQRVATGVLTGVVKVSGYFTGSLANSKMGKKFFKYLPGEVLLASLDGFSTSNNPCFVTFCLYAFFYSRGMYEALYL